MDWTVKQGRKRPKRSAQSASSIAVLTAAIILALYFGRELFVPVALALLITFVLTPAASWLERLRIGKTVSALLVVLVLVAAIGTVAAGGAIELADVAGKLPEYQANILRKVEWLRSDRPGLTKSLDTFQKIGAALNESAPKPGGTAAADKAEHLSNEGRSPLEVQVVKGQTGFLETLGVISTPMLHFLAQVAAVVVFTLFILIQRCELRDRLLHLLGVDHLIRATSALDDAASRISRYLIAQSVVNGSFGLALGTGLYVLGLPNAVFWGVCGAILRFIPYVGTFVAGGIPILLSIAVFESWTKPLLALGLFIGVEAFMSGVLEPWLYGARTGISSLAILASASFWTVLWGPIGLVLSMPLTVCMAVLGKHAPPLGFLNVLLGDRPVLEMNASYYQRLLALDDYEAARMTKAYRKEKSLAELYDLVLVPALTLSERDRHAGNLEDEQEEFIYDTTKALLEDFETSAGSTDPNDKEQGRNAVDAATAERLGSILCLAARDRVDELASLMLAQLIEEAGFKASSQPALAMDAFLKAVDKRKPVVVAICALPPYAINYARRLCRAIRMRLPDVKVVLAYLETADDKDKEALRDRLGNCADSIATSLQEARLAAVALLNSMSAAT